MKLKLLNRNEEWVKNIDVFEPCVTQTINGEDILEFSTLEEVQKNYRVVFKDDSGKWREYIISDYAKEKSEKGTIYKILAENSFYETIGDFIVEKRIRNGTVSAALAAVLSSTRWEVGNVEDLGVGTATFYHVSAKEALQKHLLTVWQGEFQTRIIVSGNKITHRYIDLLKKIGNDDGKRFVYNKDCWSIKKHVSSELVVTALHGFGKGEQIEGGYGRRLDFASVNNGKTYVEDLQALALYGRNGASGKEHVFASVVFDNCEDKNELLKLTKAELKKISEPKITYSSTVDDLSRYGLEHEGVKLGDTVSVIDKEDGLRISARVLEYKDYIDGERSNEIVLGNKKQTFVQEQIKQADKIRSFQEKQGVWDRAGMFDKDGLGSNYLKELVEELNNRMNSTGGYVYISDDGKGLTTYDKPIDQNPTKAIQLVGGGFRIANSKKPNGEFDWKTFGTGDGFVADLIVAGMLKGGKVKFNLSQGTLLIGEENNKSLYWDGSKLWIKGDGIDLTSNNEYTGFKTQITQDANSIRMTAQNANSKAEQALTADAYTRTIANRADGNASTAIQKANSIEFQFQNYSPDKVKYGTTYALTPSECYIAYNGTRKFQVSTSTGDVSIQGSFTSPHLVANQSGCQINGSYGSTLLRPSGNSLEVWGLRANNNLTMLGNLIMTGNQILNGGLAINFAYGTTYPIEMRQGVECFSGLYVHGAKNAVVDTDEGMVAVSCYEMADTYFGDIGTGVINDDGFCMIFLDDTFRKTVNTDVEYLVFLTKEGQGDIWVDEKMPAFFTVKGTKGLKFAYEIKAKRKGYEMNRLERIETKIDEVGKTEEKELVDSLSRVDIEDFLRRESVAYEENYGLNDD